MTYLEILEQVLIQSNDRNILKRASEIALNLFAVPETIIVYVNNKNLPENYKFVSGNESDYLECPVILSNPYSIDNTFKVRLPDGTERWATPCTYIDKVGSIEPISVESPELNLDKTE